ncbi:MAG: bifunctional methylenetetrahydrofolate dehydrogenase/methenyltetrahydrofolate cyclohydrolase FolD [Polyangiales bacterium]
MAAARIDGRAIAARVRQELRARVRSFVQAHGRAPGLDVVIVGDDPAARTYVRNKDRAASEVGLCGDVHELAADVSQAELDRLVRRLDAAEGVDGILLQLPLPAGLDGQAAVDALDPGKDVDGLHPFNVGLLAAGRPGLRPCTPSGCMRLLDEIGVDPAGKRAVVLGRSELVGKPIAMMLMQRDATVTVCHSRTEDLAEEVRRADILVAAVGKRRMVAGDWIKPGAVVLDVGIHRTEQGGLEGDVDFASAAERAGWITPVPGGVGPMTIAMVLSNTVEAAERRLGRVG